jgi:hypothetical protein
VLPPQLLAFAVSPVEGLLSEAFRVAETKSNPETRTASPINPNNIFLFIPINSRLFQAYDI